MLMQWVARYRQHHENSDAAPVILSGEGKLFSTFLITQTQPAPTAGTGWVQFSIVLRHIADQLGITLKLLPVLAQPHP